MKTNGLLATLAASAFLFSCQTEIAETPIIPAEPEMTSEEVVFYASAETPPQTKAAVQEDARSIWWEPGDQIKVFKGDDSGVFTTTIEEPSAEAEFRGSFSSPIADGDTFWAVYPASAVRSFDGITFTITIPTEQKPPIGSFDKDAFVAIAKSDNNNLNFRSVCGGIKFSLTRPDIDKVVIKSYHARTVGPHDVTVNSYGVPKVNDDDDDASTVVVLTPSEVGYFTPGVFYYVALCPTSFVRFLFSLYSEGRMVGAYCPINTDLKAINRAYFKVLPDLDLKMNYLTESFSVPETVDLGLPSGNLWATCNLGASAPEKSGNYYAWGEVTTKFAYNWQTYYWCSVSETTLTKYNSNSEKGIVDNKHTLEPEDDAATVALGSGWHMPKPKDITELKENCTLTWTTVNGVNGYYVKSKINSATIFLPAVGYMSAYGVKQSNSLGFYYCNYADDEASIMFFYRGSFNVWRTDPTDVYNTSRSSGMPVRPILTPNYTSPKYINVSPTSLNLERGSTYTIKASVGPSGDYDHSVDWESSNPEVATVDDKGTVHALADGESDIIATTIVGGLSASCHVTVSLSLEGISINQTNLQLTVGETAPIIVSYSPEDATNKTVSWISENEQIATVSEDGHVYAVAAGSTNVKAVAEDGGYVAECAVRVYDLPERIVLSEEAVELAVGESLTLVAAIQPDDIMDNTIQWISSDAGIATVSSDGIITGVSEGQAIVTATAYNGVSASAAVRVVPYIPVASITLDAESLIVIEPYQTKLTATVLPEDATNKEITWESSDVSVATVSSTGIVKGISKGTAVVTAFASDNISASCVVEVRSYTPDAVDMGLPSGTKWASFNLGATSPEEDGWYFGWGERMPNQLNDLPYDWNQYTWWDKSAQKLTKYCTQSGLGTVDNKTVLESQDDAACLRLGGSWHIPTDEEFTELSNNCSKSKQTYNGVDGYLFVSNINGNSIFFPASGAMVDETVVGKGSVVNISTSTLSYNSKWFKSYQFSNDSFSSDPYRTRCYGNTIRPVTK